MKKAKWILSVLFIMGIINAQQGQIAVGGQLGFSMPMGDFSQIAKTGFGFSGNFLYTINQDIDIYGSIGRMAWKIDDQFIDDIIDNIAYDVFEYSGINLDYNLDTELGYKTNSIIIGGRYYLERQKFSPYGMVELGIHLLNYTHKIDGTITYSYSYGYGYDYELKENIRVNESTSSSELGLGLGGGFLYDLGNIILDVNGKINFISELNNVTIMVGILYPLK